MSSSKLDEQGRIGIKIPSKGSSYQAYFAAPMAGDGRGLVFLPDPGDQVVVAFINGQGNMPVVLGTLWSTKARPPTANTEGTNDLKLIQTRSGHQVRLSDKPGKESIEIIDSSGSCKVSFDTTTQTITVTARQGVTIKGDLTVEGITSLRQRTTIGSDLGPKTIIEGNQITGQ
ncbi:phage baseplate assembly protein V [Cyanobium sp. La Preciosa 7G6]|uniref:phage baseplate assembly protein V n=1 Tax=Cyanobium sp. La Preciosa 7G6 TaxID=2823715 RepID=UPI0020CE26CE|nr:phage baseplate assembly protein V [Cyanobium sp. La Preciosa 7G6]